MGRGGLEDSGVEPIVNVSSRYGGLDFEGRKVIGLNNIELITDRPLEVNLAEVARTKKAHPGHALWVSLMEESKRESWHEIVKRTQDAGADGLELNFGCPHGMSERGMGSAVGQVPEYAAMITGWVKEVATVPVMVKLTPNVADITSVGRAAVGAGADALSLINTINSIMGVDLDTFAPKPSVRGQGTHGGYCGPAVKPIALNMVAALAADPAITVPICGIGGIAAWQDAAEFFLLGAGAVQVCTAVMHHGFRVVEHLSEGLRDWMSEKGIDRLPDLVGRTVPRIKKWSDLDLNYKVVARIDQSKCIHCGLCYAACEDGCHQSIRWDKVPRWRRRGQRPCRSTIGRGRDHARRRGRDRQPLHDQGRRLRRLQHVQPRLSGRRVHHHDRGRHRQAADVVERVSGEAGDGRRRADRAAGTCLKAL